MQNKMEQVESLLIWLASGEKDEDGNCLGDNDTQLVCEALEYYLNMHGQKNKMEQVAQMFGKKLDEQFYINSHKRKRIAKFTVFGILVLDEVANPCEWYLQYALLNDLLTGDAEIVEDEE